MTLLSNIFSFITNKFYFRIIYLFVSIATITMLRFIPGIHTLNSVLIFWGLILILFSIFQYIKSPYKLSKFEVSLYVFLFITGLFTLIKYFNVPDIKVFLINCIIFISLFSIERFKTKKYLLKEINLISLFYTALTFFLSMASCIMLIFDKRTWISETINNEYIVHYFTNLYTNENSLGISAVLSLMISIFILTYTKNKILKYFCFSNILIQLLTLILSNSRNVYLGLIAFIFVFIFMYSKKPLHRLALICIPSILFIVIIFLYKDNLSTLLTGRENLWGTALILIKNNPIFGTGFNNFLPSMEQFQIGGLGGIELGGLHNIYIQIATIHGLIALIIFLIALSILIYTCINKIDSIENKSKIIYVSILGITISILTMNLLESNLIYIISFINIIFWIFSSYLLSLLNSDNK